MSEDEWNTHKRRQERTKKTKYRQAKRNKGRYSQSESEADKIEAIPVQSVSESEGQYESCASFLNQMSLADSCSPVKIGSNAFSQPVASVDIPRFSPLTPQNLIEGPVQAQNNPVLGPDQPVLEPLLQCPNSIWTEMVGMLNDNSGGWTIDHPPPVIGAAVDSKLDSDRLSRIESVIISHKHFHD